MVYTHDLKSCPARDVGSSPTSGTRKFENIILDFLYAPIAQLVEQSPLKRTVEGSNPSGRTVGRVAELVYAHALGACSVRIGSSSLPSPTILDE